MTFSRGRRRKVLKILKKRNEGRKIQPGEIKSIGRYLREKEENG